MLNFLYLLKVILCSLVFVSYYLVALRNKIFHQYNRFYLLFAVFASWMIPLLPINIFIEQKASDTTFYSVIDFVNKQNIKPYSTPTSGPLVITSNGLLSFENIVVAAFVFTAFYFAITLIINLFNIKKLKKKYLPYELANCTIYLTKEKYTPYSFFKTIFWNNQIDIESKLGQQILQHELVHIHEKHSLDKLFIQLNLIIGWFNPLFWFIKSELEMIHEFIADKKSIPNGDTSEFAKMILSIAQVNKNIPLTNPFFFSPIKRRLQMLTQKSSISFGYTQRLFVLPVVIVLVVLISLKTKQAIAKTPNLFSSAANELENNKQEIKVAEIIIKKKNDREYNDNEIVEQLTQNTTSKDSMATTINELKKQYATLELQYKKETAIAVERKKLMELLEQLSLDEVRMLDVFNSIINTPNNDKVLQKRLKQELEQKVGKEKLKIIWKEKNNIQNETTVYLKN